jgi:hypothetical protein
VSLTQALLAEGFRKEGPPHEGVTEIAARGVDISKYYSFGFVRNPWARLASWYVMFRNNPLANTNNAFWNYVRPGLDTFDKFLTYTDIIVADTNVPRGITRPQCRYFQKDGIIVVSRIFKYEEFRQAVRSLEKHLTKGLFPRRLRLHVPLLNKFEDYDYKDFYNAQSRRLVASWYEEDIDIFGYTFDGQ